MGVPDNSVLDLIDRVRSWISWGASDFTTFSSDFNMDQTDVKSCSGCEMKFTKLCHKYNCQVCSRLLCGACVRTSGSLIILAAASDAVDIDKLGQTDNVIKSCKFCSKASKRHIDKVYPSESPGASPETPSPSCGAERICCGSGSTLNDHVPIKNGFSCHTISCSSLTLSTGHPSPISICHSAVRSDEDEAEDVANHFLSPSSEYYHDCSDLDIHSLSLRHEHYNFRSSGSSPSDSPSRINVDVLRARHSVQKERKGSPKPQSDDPLNQDKIAVLVRHRIGIRDAENADGYPDNPCEYLPDEDFQKPLDFENNGLIWFPPPPEDEGDEADHIYFEDDDGYGDIGESSGMFSSSNTLPILCLVKEKETEGKKEPFKCVIQGHFRALVSQLLQGEGIKGDKGIETEDWLDIISTLAWQAASFVRPDTSRGGSMDPVDYVKVKCVASGRPGESTLVKGVVCTKNIKHKRMTSQYKNPRLLLLGGSLEYQRAPNELSSFNTLLEEEMNHLKAIVSKIEAHQTNVLLVEKSVSSYAQEYLLAKEISLVLNVKRPLLERIACCTGALITPSLNNISTARVGHCELFHLEKISEDLEMPYQANKRPSKTLMYFEGCPKRLGCTVLLKGSSREELKKLKHVVHYAVFAAYHLSLETSFLADEGATLPKMKLKSSLEVPEGISVDNFGISAPNFIPDAQIQPVFHSPGKTEECKSCNLGFGGLESCSFHLASASLVDANVDNVLCDKYCDDSVSEAVVEFSALRKNHDLVGLADCFSDNMNHSQNVAFETGISDERKLVDSGFDEYEVPSEYFSSTDGQQSILVSFSSHCVLEGTICERSRLLRIKFYGSFDKPLGKYLRDDLFDQASYCRSCKKPVEAHVQCFTHQLGSLTINVRRLSPGGLPGEKDGKIWMWHRCLRCAHIDGVPPATRRVVMSDAAWGLSFGKFLELSFSNHATANRVAGCGHSLQRDCLRFYGFGSMVAFFHYSPVEILSVQLPPSMLDFNGHSRQEWIKMEASQVKIKMEKLYREIGDVLQDMEQKSRSLGHGSSDCSDLHKHILELKDLLDEEQNDYYDLLEQAWEDTSESENVLDILELNNIRRSLLAGSDVWNRQLYSLDSLLTSRDSIAEGCQYGVLSAELKELKSDSISSQIKVESEAGNVPEYLKAKESSLPLLQKDGRLVSNVCERCDLNSHQQFQLEEIHVHGEVIAGKDSSGCRSSPASSLSDKIDFAWTGTDQHPMKAQLPHLQSDTMRISAADNLPIKRLMGPARMYSFDSAMRLKERLNKGLPSSVLYLASLRSFHGSGDYRSMIRRSIPNVLRTYSQPREAQKLPTSVPSYIKSAVQMTDGARLLLPQIGQSDLVVAVYDDEPTSIVSYALSSKEHEEWVFGKLKGNEGSSYGYDAGREEFTASSISAWQSFGSVDLDYINYGSFGSEDASCRSGTIFSDAKKSPHLKISFEDESCANGKAKFSVTCYFATEFDMLRKKCCPSEVEFVCSLSRCKRWSAQGGKSNVYFAKSMDERFIIKQVTKTELDSFVEFAPDYFQYLTDSLNSGCPTCLAKVLGIYQVSVKQVKGGKETKMDLMVMENLFFKRNISRIYDLKGSSRSRYNSDAAGSNKVLLDMNFLEALRTNPMFLGSRAKRRLERAVWNDTSFLASVDVMDYSLLVGVDEERNELVVGIIDFMRQYTWDKHLETWVKASGILGGPKNASPTIISPKQYKRRFRKAMTAYFLTVPDQWSS